MTEFEFDPIVVDRLNKFKEKVSKDGVSKSAVLSIEEFVGNNFITQKHNIRKFTDLNTTIAASSVIKEVDIVLSKINIINEDTVEDLTNLMTGIKETLSRLIEVMKKVKLIDESVIRELGSNTHSFSYRNNENAEIDNINDITKTHNISNVLIYRADYWYSVITKLTGDKELANKLYKFTENIPKNDLVDSVLPLLNSLLIDDYDEINLTSIYRGYDISLKQFTIEDFVSVYDNIDTVIKSLDVLYDKTVASFRALRERAEEYTFLDKKELQREKKRLSNFSHFLDDPLSLLVINTISNVLNIKLK